MPPPSRLLLGFLFTAIVTFCQGQGTQKFNLDYENYNPVKDLPEGWFQWGSYQLAADSIVRYSGNYSARISSGPEGSTFGSIAYNIPANYEGDTIRLTANMKTMDVENGFAGLLLRVDGSAGTLVFSNMKDQNITGTNDWKEYSITLPFPKESKNIYVAGILVGKGTAWFDDFIVHIDKEDLQIKKEKEKPIFLADLDTEFDSGSTCKFPPLTDQKIQRIALLVKIWGFLKYYHPEIGKGNLNWDYELFRILPKVLSVTTQDTYNMEITTWIESLGELSICENCEPASEDAFLKPDLFWITDGSLDSSIKSLLSGIYKNRHQGDHFYFGFERTGNVRFKNEKAYESVPYPDEGYRILCLFRYWNMIQYFFPYKHLIGKDWDTVLEEFIPAFIEAGDELEYEIAVARLISELNDTHAQLNSGADKIEHWRGYLKSPLHLDFIQNQPVVTDYYNSALIEEGDPEVGDIITHVNEIPVEQLTDNAIKYYSASNEVAKMTRVVRDLLRANKEFINIRYSDGTTSKNRKIKLYKPESLKISEWYRGNKKPSHELLDNNIGYVTLQTISQGDIAKIKQEYQNTKGIIIDIRNYPAVFVPFALGSYFVSKPTPFAKFTKPNSNNPGEFIFTDPVVIEPDANPYRGKLVVLVNQRSISQSEYTTMAFRAGDNTTILGNTTAGADGNISRIVLPGNLSTIISGIGVYYPDGTETQRIGIIPDIEVQPTIQGVRERRDELLEKAIEFILKD